MSLAHSSSFLEFLDCVPEFFAFHWISFKVSLDIVGHTFSEFSNSAGAHSLHIDQFLTIEFVDEGEDIPEEIADFEFELAVRQALMQKMGVICLYRE